MKLYIILKYSLDENEMIERDNEFISIFSNIYDTFFYYKKEERQLYNGGEAYNKYYIKIYDIETSSIIDAEDDSFYNQYYDEFIENYLD